MAEVQGQGSGTDAVLRWRAPLETTALILMAAIGFSIVGGIVSAVFSPDVSAWQKLNFLGFNVVSIWHVAVLVIAVGLVLALRIPFPPDARGASTVRAALLGAAALGAVIALSAVIASIGAIGDNEAFVGFSWPEKIGNIMQWLAGAAVAGAVALLAVRSQGVVPAPTRPAPAPAPPPPVAAPAAAPGAPGWAADPYGRHQWRYWDGNRWTEQVADGSTQSTDPAQ
jgi:uncharacterized protein DUF2510